MCSGRVDLEFVLRAFSNGQDGVLIIGCRLNECNYATHGNFDALANTYICKNILERIGLDPDRLRIEFMSGGEGNRLAEVIKEFTARIKELGPLGEAERIKKSRLKPVLEGVRRLVPYLRLVEREKLRVPVRSEQSYREFFECDEVNRLFDEMIGEKLTVSRVVSLLREKPLSTAEISEALGLSSSEVAKRMNSSSRQGLVMYDVDSNRYTLTVGGA
jgi:coenzyme F420-reducing hydrogenase delta subunit/biotin operon repressor